MAKCRLLYQENEELGKMTSNGRLAKLESELALQKSYNEEVKKSQLGTKSFHFRLYSNVCYYVSSRAMTFLSHIGVVFGGTINTISFAARITRYRAG